MRKILFLGSLILLVCGAVSAQITDVPDTPKNEIYLAKDDGEGKAGEPAILFDVNDIPIHCVVKLVKNDPATVKMSLVAVKVGGVKPETKVVTTSYSTSNGENEVHFQGKPYKAWHPGIYRADITVNGKLLDSIEFSIKGDAAIPKVANTFVRPVKRSPPTKKN